MIPHKGLTTTVPCSKGIKQGSRGRRFEWNLVMRYLLLQLGGARSMQWIWDHVQNFADDHHLRWSGETEADFHRALREAAEFLELLEGYGFLFNIGKSAAINRLVGPRQAAFNKQYIARRKNGVCLKFIGKSKTFWIPVAKKWDYLGATITYRNFEADTVLRRIKASDHAFARLKPVLGCHRKLKLCQRLAVHTACVTSTLHYAIFASIILCP